MAYEHCDYGNSGASIIKALRNRIFMPFLLQNITNRFACSKSAAEGIFSKNDCIIIPNVISTEKFSFCFRKAYGNSM